MKIYTRQGDDGSTGLLGSRRVSKSDPRIDCCGTLDEINAAIGVTVAQLQRPDDSGVITSGTHLTELIERLIRVQGELFVLGAHVAVPSDQPAPSSVPAMDREMIGRLEREIDTADGQLAPLTSFILPGGAIESAHLHLARAICRRGERILVALHESEGAPRHALAYLNRLADWLFVQARLINHLARIDDIPWDPKHR